MLAQSPASLLLPQFWALVNGGLKHGFTGEDDNTGSTALNSPAQFRPRVGLPLRISHNPSGYLQPGPFENATFQVTMGTMPGTNGN